MRDARHASDAGGSTHFRVADGRRDEGRGGKREERGGTKYEGAGATPNPWFRSRVKMAGRLMDSMNSPDLISVLRRPDGLFACLIHRAEEFTRPLPDAAEAKRDLGTLDPYREHVVPLREVSMSEIDPLKSVLRSWVELGHIERFDETTLVHLVNVLIHSLPESTSRKNPAPLAFEPEPAAWRPTAANPRAYKGTKDRPPKLRKPKPIDVRPHLVNSLDVNALVVRLSPFERAARRLLKKRDVLDGDLPPLLDVEGRAQDVYLACLHQAGSHSLFSLPDLFLRGFMYSQRGEPWRRIARMLALFRSLDLEHAAPLRRCVSRLLAAARAEALGWCELIV